MKVNIFKPLAITCLLLIGSAAFANEASEPAAKADKESTEAAKSADSAAAKTADAKKESKESGNKAKSGTSGRALGGLLANKTKAANTDSSSDSAKRIKELEDLVQEQKKLLDMYKNQNK